MRVAWEGDEIAGLCISRPRRGEDETVGWVGVLAVTNRMGGTALRQRIYLQLSSAHSVFVTVTAVPAASPPGQIGRIYGFIRPKRP